MTRLKVEAITYHSSQFCFPSRRGAVTYSHSSVMSKAQKFTFFNNLAKFHSPYFYLNIHLAKITLYIMVLSNKLAK